MIGRRHRLSRDPRTGIYYVKVQVEKARKRFTFGKNRKPAEAALRKLEHELSAGRIQIGAPPPVSVGGSPDGVRLGALVQRHLEWVQNNRSPATFACRRHFLAAFLKFAGDCRVAGDRPAATAGASRRAAPVPEWRRRPVQAAGIPAPASALVQAGGHPAPAAVRAPAHVREHGGGGEHQPDELEPDHGAHDDPDDLPLHLEQLRPPPQGRQRDRKPRGVAESQAAGARLENGVTSL